MRSNIYKYILYMYIYYIYICISLKGTVFPIGFHNQLRLLGKNIPRLHALGVSIAKIDRPVRYGMLSVPRV